MDADAGGEEAAGYWLDVLAHNARRWRPLFDDPAAMLQAGLDMRQWVEAGLKANELENTCGTERRRSWRDMSESEH